MYKHQINPQQKARSRLCATYINRTRVLEIKVLLAQTKNGAGRILHTACERCLCQNSQVTKCITNVHTKLTNDTAMKPP
jgi:hypothetical protein